MTPIKKKPKLYIEIITDEDKEVLRKYWRMQKQEEERKREFFKKYLQS